MIELEGRLEPRDYVRAQYLTMRPRRIFVIAGLVVLAAFSWALWYSFFGGGASKRGIIDYLMLAAAAYLIFNFSVYVPWRARKTFRQQKSMQREIRWRFADTGVSIELEQSHGEVPWSDFLKWKENDHLFLLYVSDPLFYMLPKRLFESAGDVDGLREMLRSYIGPSAA